MQQSRYNCNIILFTNISTNEFEYDGETDTEFVCQGINDAVRLHKPKIFQITWMVGR